MIKIFNLAHLFNINNAKENRRLVKLVHIKRGNINFALLVDEFLKESEIVIKHIDDQKSGVRGISGAAILDDGSVSLIIDPFTISN